MNPSAAQWHGQSTLEFLCRHLVGLCITYERKSADRTQQAPRFTAYSGTLIRIRDAVCLLTAGHILREVEKALNDDQVDIKSAVLADTFGWKRVTDHPIPFDLKNAPLFYVDDDREGLDFGVIMLAPYYVRLLAANGMVALEEQNWVHQHSIRFDEYMMLGLPEEFTSDHVSATGEALVSPTLFAIQRLEAPPAGSAATNHLRFVGQISPDLAIDSVKGMSGGPIFGFHFGHEMRYWVVALQSAWEPTRRVIYGCPLPILASIMTNLSEPIPTQAAAAASVAPDSARTSNSNTPGTADQ